LAQCPKILKKGKFEMSESESCAVKTIELTEIVEIGLPLDELPASSMKQNSSVADVSLPEDGGERGSDLLEENYENDYGDDFELDLDAFDDGDTFADADTPDEDDEDNDEVLIGLKNAGLRLAPEVLPEVKDAAELLSLDRSVLETEVDAQRGDQRGDLEGSRDESGTAAVKPANDLSSQDAEPEGYGVELPEDYLVEEDEPAAEMSTEKVESEPAAGSEAGLDKAAMSAADSASIPHVLPEPQPLDFSRQIEDMTRIWSKQLLETTYSSMDKMIQAVGNLAPTIVDQVAREIIPPLAEKVIKAEIARLEETLALEEDETD
jgi:hypothetical protein